MDAYVLNLDEIQPEQRHLVGSKAITLADLRQAGFNVPPGFCVTTTALRETLALLPSIPLETGVEEQENLRRESLLAADLPPKIVKAIAQAYTALGGAVAVRSSALQEDLSNASFAGQYDTYLNLTGLSNVLAGIRSCWASLWNERVVAYRRHRGMEAREPSMGVIVQRQVPAQVSGMLFTLNPLTGREEEMAIEATWGLGEAVVSGRVSPDRFVVNPWESMVIERHIAQKRVMVVPGPGSGVQEIAVPNADIERAALSDNELLSLAELGLRIQEMYGIPLDIEWALYNGQFYVLQARPLTSVTFSPDMGQWTSANFREIMPGLVNPLSFSVNLQYEWGKAFDEFFTRMKMQLDKKPVEWGRTFFGRAYWNVGEVKRRAALIPGFRERLMDETVGIEPTYEGDGLVTPTNLYTLLRALPVLLALNHLYACVWKEADAAKRGFLDEDAKLLAVDPHALSDDELVAYVRHVIEFHAQVNHIALMVSFLSTQAEDDFRHMVDTLNKGLPESEQVAMGNLLTGLGEVKTTRPLVDLWELAQQASLNPRLSAIIQQAPVSEMLKQLESCEEGHGFIVSLRAYLQRYAYMASGDEDFTAPRWIEDPTFVLTTLKSYVEGGAYESPAAILSKQAEIRRRERERVRRLLNRNLVNRLLPFRKRTFFSQMLLVRRYCWWREETRDILARAHYQCHRFIGELGRRWAVMGRTNDPLDIFYLTRGQLLDVLEGKATEDEARRWIRRQRRMLACYRNFEPPSTIGRGSRLHQEKVSVSAQCPQYVGVPCSPGIATGPARIITTLSDAGRLRRGDILIAPYTNPGWTPLFSLAGAIIMEEGGLLSHGAVVARECGIPAVLRISGATQLFKDGQILRVDGGRGTVDVLQE